MSMTFDEKEFQEELEADICRLAKSSCKGCYGTGFVGTRLEKIKGKNVRNRLTCPCIAKNEAYLEFKNKWAERKKIN